MENEILGVVITDGVGYRNFVMSNFITEVSKSFHKVIIYSGLPIAFFDINLIPSNVDIVDLPVYTESRKVWFFRKLKEVSHMYLHRDFYGINDNLTRGYPKSHSKSKVIIKIIYAIAKCFNSEKSINTYEKHQFKFLTNSSITNVYREIFKTANLDILFFTHQRPAYLAPVLSIAQVLGIKTSSFIFSWDNLASKGRMLGEFDSYMVWSELMKDELKYFYPNTNEDKIYIVGTPQFEPYIMDEYKIDKSQFYEKFGLDSSKKIICYSCADADIGRNDEVHIRGVLSYMKKQDTNTIQLLVRTSPAEDGKRFENLKNEFPEIKWNIPKWILTRDNHVESWSQRLPSYEDVIDLKSILSFADVNVNMCSTMSLDFMLFDKPVINSVFGNENNGLYNDQKYLNYVHYDRVVKSGAVVVAKNEEELISAINIELETPYRRTNKRKELLSMQIGAPLEGTSKRIAKVLNELR